MSAGSQNRDTKKAISHLESAKNLKSVCKCILHAKNSAEGSLIDRTRFNRQGNGIQSMCAEGKTLIDAIKHQFWRTIDIVLLTAIKESNLYNKEYYDLLSIPFFQKYGIDQLIKEIFQNHNMDSFKNSLNPLSQNQVNVKIYFETSGYLEENLKLKNLKFYSIFFNDETLALQEYKQLEKDFKNFTNVKKYEVLEDILRNLLLNDFDYSLYVKETAQNGVFYDASMISFNWSKKNNLYIKVNNGYEITNYRGPFHNTKKKAVGTTSRMIRFLVEGDAINGFKEVNAYIQSIKKPGYEADHIWPLALGGKHTIENLVSLPEKENLLKKDHITFKAYCLLIESIKNMSKMISGDFLTVVLKYYHKIEDNEQLFQDNVKQFELELKRLMEKRQDNFETMTEKEKIYFLAEMRKDLINPDKALKFVERFERNRG